MPKLIIDSREIEVAEGTNVLEAAEKLGIMIPRFCYHPAMGSIGACRVCAVMFLEGPVKGVEMSCMTKVKDGMVVSTTHPEAMEFRRYVIEWLMLHHPLDCPVCDEGGHCLLQDETVSGGHGIRRYIGPKRTYFDQDLGLFVKHEMNRCIQCWRCRRFYQEFAGYRDLGAMGIGNRTYFGRYGNGPLESPFAGNLIDVCPTGVFTDKPSRYKGRRWDYERAPSLCLHCSLGCNIVGSARYREIVRLEARLNEAVNGYFMCDRGRYGFSYVNRLDRPRRARLKAGEVPWSEAIRVAAAGLAQISRKYGPEAVACVAGIRSSLETQGAFKLFCRTHGWREPQFFWDPLVERKVKSAVKRLDDRLAVSLRQIEAADFILVAGADPVNEAPMLALALRQAARRKARIVVLDPRPIFLTCEFEHLAVPPWKLDKALSALIKGALTNDQAAGLPEPVRKFYEAISALSSEEQDMAKSLGEWAAALQKSKKPVIVCGTGIVQETTPSYAADLALLLKQAGKIAGLFYLLPGANAFGAALLAAPGQSETAPLAEARWPWGPAALGEPLAPGRPALSGPQILDAIDQGEIKALVLVETDPFWQFYDEERLPWALDKLEFLVVLDYVPSPTVGRAHVLLPTISLFEQTASSYVNNEGRAQTASPVFFGGTPIAQISPDVHPPRTFLNYVPGSDPRSPAEIFHELTRATSGLQAPLPSDLWAWLARQNPLFTKMASLAQHPEGLRLLPAENSAADFISFSAPPPPPPPPDTLELLLVDWTFGTEELSGYAELLQQAEAAPLLMMHPADAPKFGLRDGNRAAIHLPKGSLAVKVKLSSTMAPGVAVLPRHRQLDWRKLSETPVYLTLQHIDKVQG